MLEKQKGIIIKSVDYGESDKIITILNEHGAKIPLMVRRAKNQNRFTSPYATICVWLIYYNKWKGMGTLSSVDVINQYYDLRLDIFNSSYATLCTEAIERSMDNDDISPFHYKLYTSYLKRSQMVIQLN